MRLTKTTKIFFPSNVNSTIIGRTNNNNALDFTDGGLIMNNTSPIFNQSQGCTIYGGNGFFIVVIIFVERIS